MVRFSLRTSQGFTFIFSLLNGSGQRFSPLSCQSSGTTMFSNSHCSVIFYVYVIFGFQLIFLAWHIPLSRDASTQKSDLLFALISWETFFPQLKKVERNRFWAKFWWIMIDVPRISLERETGRILRSCAGDAKDPIYSFGKVPRKRVNELTATRPAPVIDKAE